jgi:hypothetical protein
MLEYINLRELIFQNNQTNHQKVRIRTYHVIKNAPLSIPVKGSFNYKSFCRILIYYLSLCKFLVGNLLPACSLKSNLLGDDDAMHAKGPRVPNKPRSRIL